MKCAECTGSGWWARFSDHGTVCPFCGGSGKANPRAESVRAMLRSLGIKKPVGRAGSARLLTPTYGEPMNAKHLKALAAQFDELAAIATAIGGTFRTAADAGGEDDGDGDAGGKPARNAGGKPGKDSKSGGSEKGGKSGKKGGKEASDDDEVTEDTLRERLKELATAKGKDKMAEALAHVDVERLPDVDEDDYAKLNDKITELLEAEDDAGEEDEVDLKASKKAFKKLDAKAQKAVLKECGIKSLDDLDEDDEDEVKEFCKAVADAE